MFRILDSASGGACSSSGEAFRRPVEGGFLGGYESGQAQQTGCDAGCEAAAEGRRTRQWLGAPTGRRPVSPALPNGPLQYVRKQTPSVAIDSGGRYGAMQPSRASDEGALGVTWMCQSEHYEGAGWSGCWLENRTILTPPARAGDGGGRCRLLQRPGSAGGRAPRAIARGTADASADLCALENGP